MADYSIRKDRITGHWNLQFKDNKPIGHYSFTDAWESLEDLLRLTAAYHHGQRSHVRERMSQH